jgi:hypothetical protein
VKLGVIHSGCLLRLKITNANTQTPKKTKGQNPSELPDGISLAFGDWDLDFTQS